MGVECLSKAELLDFVINGSTPERSDDIEKHLSECERCKKLLEELDSDPEFDALLRQRTAARRTPPTVKELNRFRTESGTPPATPNRDWRSNIALPKHSPLIAEKLLGAGGFGVVYRAHDNELNRQVAIKFLPPHSNLREAETMAKVSHPNLATVHFINQQSNECPSPFIVMEHLGGGSLRDWMDDHPVKNRDYRDIAELIRSAASGLVAMHANGIVHRDIKPSNLMLDSNGVVKVVDFGLAENSEKLRVASGFAGTYRYASPEQRAGKELDEATDVYSLGVVLAELLTDMRPTDDGARLQSRSINPSIPSVLDLISEKCSKTDPTERLTAVELRDDLDRLLKGKALKHLGATTYGKSLVAQHRVSVSMGLIFCLVVGSLSWILREKDRELQRSEFLRITDYIENRADFVFGNNAADRRELEKKLLESMEQYRKAELGDNDVELLLTATQTINDLAIVFTQFGNSDEAISMYLDAIDVLDQLVEDHPSNVDLIAIRLNCMTNYGLLLIDTSERATEGRVVLEEVIKASRDRIDEYPDDFRFSDTLARCLNSLGNQDAERLLFAEAESKYSEGITIRRTLRGQLSGDDYLNNTTELGNLLVNLATLNEEDRSDSTWDTLMEGHEILRSVMDEMQSLEHVATFANSFNHLGTFAYDEHDLADAKTNYENAYEIWLTLTQEAPNIPSFVKELAAVQSNIGNVHWTERAFDDAGKAYVAAESKLNSVAVHLGDSPDFKYKLAIVEINVASWMNEIGQYSEALAKVTKAIDTLTELSETTPRVMRNLRYAIELRGTVTTASIAE
ncbi:MAG: protein kinase [Planctomycetota bacterium]